MPINTFMSGNNINIKRFLGVGIIACVGSACLFAASMLSNQAIAEENPAQEEQAGVENLTDSLAVNETQRLNEVATAAYKDLKFIQYDGVTEAELYPRVIDVYGKIREVMDAPQLSDADQTRFKGMLLDLSDLLRRGSLYYSSQGDSDKMSDFATAYVDLRLDSRMNDMKFGKDSDLYPALIYCAGSNAYNKGDFGKAVDYLEAYLSTGATDRREQVTLFLGQACLNAGVPERGVNQLVNSVDLYPANFNLLMLALQLCLDSGHTDRMQPLITKALAMRPDDETLLNAQGRLLENEGNYQAAIDVFQRLYELKPNSMNVNQHLALNYYNLGADYYNKAIMESDEKLAKRYSRQAQAYFQTALGNLETVVDNDPTNAKYLRALALTYGCLGDQVRLDEVNVRLQALGKNPLPMKGMPEAITFDDNKGGVVANTAAIPDFQEFAKGFVEKRLSDWSKRGEFERMEDFEKRVNRDNVYQQYQMLCKEAETEYLRKYAGRLRVSDLTLEPYDVENESYLIKSDMGPIVVKVPLKNKEAEVFKSGWNAVQVKNPKFYIANDRVAIASVDLVTSAGKTYSYNAANAANYDFTDVRIDMESFIRGRDSHGVTSDGQGIADKSKVLRAKSDVDDNIPVTSRKAEKSVALIISNENYKQVSKVESALNDGETFAQYCKSTLGIPESQILQYSDATYAEMLGAMTKLRNMSSALGDNVDVIVYYAGHGFPDEKDKDAYLLPVDGDGFTPATSYPLKKFYVDLASLGADNVMVFLDACFSGVTRTGDPLHKTRGIALKPRDTAAEGNMYVLSAASDQETALPYREKNHGLFTYFLLKKIQETKGNVTLSDLSKYMEETVKKNSMTVNRKLQTPRTTLSGRMREDWTSKKLRP